MDFSFCFSIGFDLAKIAIVLFGNGERSKDFAQYVLYVHNLIFLQTPADAIVF